MSQNQNKQPSVAELLEMSRTEIVAEAFLWQFHINTE